MLALAWVGRFVGLNPTRASLRETFIVKFLYPIKQIHACHFIQRLEKRHINRPNFILIGPLPML